MSVTTGQIGYGFVLSQCATLGGSYVAVAQIEDIKPGKKTVDKIKIERNDSPDLYGEKIPGWKDVGEWDVKVTYDKTQRATLEALLGVVKFWKFIRPDGTSTTAFQAFMTEIGDEVPLKSQMTTDFKLTVSGDAAFTAGS